MKKQDYLLIRLMLFVVIMLCTSGSGVMADDTDIYLTPGAGSAAPLIMLSLDYRSNMGATVCTGTECNFLVANCSTTLLTDGDVKQKDSNGNYLMDDGGDDGVASIDFYLDGDWLPDVKGNQVCVKPTTFLGLLRAAIRFVFYDINDTASVDEIMLGIMMSHANINNCEGPTHSNDPGCANGGFILKKMTSIESGTDFDQVYRSLHKLSPPDTAGHTYQGAELFFELYRYLSGQAVYNGHVGSILYEYDSGQNEWDQTLADDINSMLEGDYSDDNTKYYEWSWDANAVIATEAHKADPSNSAYSQTLQYQTPVTEQCSKVSTMNFLFQVSSQENDSDTEIAQAYESGSDASGGLGFNPSANNAFNEVIQKLNTIDLGDGNHGVIGDYDDNFKINVKSFFYVKSNQDTAVNKVQDYAVSGGTTAQVINDDPALFVQTLMNDLNTILSVSSTFVSASIPINVFNKAEFLDNVFLAIFEAAEEPYWVGNLKRLRLDIDGNKIRDVNGMAAFDSNGKIAENALTYWTTANGRSVPTDGNNPGKDGQIVNAGGAGQKIPGFMGDPVTSAGAPGDDNDTVGNRQLFTDPTAHAVDGSTTDLVAVNVVDAANYWGSINRLGHKSSGTFDNSTKWSTSTDYPVNDDNDEQTTASNIMRYIRGQDVAVSSTDSRDWIMGDPMHSRPLPINYGALGSYSETYPDIRILIGSNDGYLRMILNSNTDGTPNGKEVWAFMPREMMAIQKRLMDNNIPAGTIPHPYGLDGTTVIYAKDSNSNSTLGDVADDSVQAFLSLRRGGKSYYALDISDPDEPKFKWKISNTADNGDNEDHSFDNLSLSFSTPKVARIKYYDDSNNESENVALLFAGGYDVNKDTRGDAVGTNDSEGNAIYIVNADTGVLIKAFTQYKNTDGTMSNFPDSMPGAVNALDTNGDNIVDRIYIGDTGGNIWRLDMPLNGSDNSDDRDHWFAHKFASLGRHTTDNTLNDRRFFHKVDVVFTRNSDGSLFDAVIAGSGDRANPKDTGYIDDDDDDTDGSPLNRLFMIKDTRTSIQDYSVLSDNNTLPAAVVSGNLADLTSNCYQDVDIANAVADAAADDAADAADYAAAHPNDIDAADYAANTAATAAAAAATAVAAASGCDEITADGIVNGWYMGLRANEKILSSSLTLGGTIFSTSYIPSGGVANSCAPGEGFGYLYALNLSNATYATIDYHVSNDADSATESAEGIYDLGTGIPASPVAIGGEKILLPGGKIVKASDSESGLTYWYETSQ